MVSYSGSGHSVSNVSTKGSCSSGSVSRATQNKNEMVIRSLHPGDLVKFNRGYYFHWAVFIGEDNLVVELTSDSKRQGEIKICHCKYDDKDAMTEVSSLDTGVCRKCKRPYKAKSRVTIQPIQFVAGDSIIMKANEYDGKCTPLKPDEIVERAKSKVGPAHYHWLQMNCEHFATWCRYDMPKSSQSWVLWRRAGDFVKALKQNVM